jgi:hypothetical protein
VQRRKSSLLFEEKTAGAMRRECGGAKAVTKLAKAMTSDRAAADREKVQSGSECDTFEQQQSRASAKRILAGRPCKCGLAIAKLCENAMQILCEYCSAHAGEG